MRFGQYDSLYFDYVKYENYLRLKKEYPDKRFIIVWTCNCQSYYWEFTEEDEDENGDAVFYSQLQVMDRRRGQGMKPNHMTYVFNEHIRPLADFE